MKQQVNYICQLSKTFRLLEEILCYDPDIVCCQEVDHFEDFLQPFGYRGIFAPKPSSPCLQVSSKPDGCAIFFKEGVVLTHSSVLSFKNQNQISLIGVFEWNSKQMIVATTHLKAQKDQNGESIRVAETQELLAYLESKYATLPIIIAADLNATPTPSSDYPSLVYPIFQQNQYQSAYATILGQELSYSTWKSRYGQDPIKHTIDYIWCNREWQIHGCLDVPQVLDQQLIPSYRYGSDHFALLTEISYLN